MDNNQKKLDKNIDLFFESINSVQNEYFLIDKNSNKIHFTLEAIQYLLKKKTNIKKDDLVLIKGHSAIDGKYNIDKENIFKNLKENELKYCIFLDNFMSSKKGSYTSHFEPFVVVKKNNILYLINIKNDYIYSKDMKTISIPKIQYNSTDCSTLCVEFLKYISTNGSEIVDKIIADSEKLNDIIHLNQNHINRYPIFKYIQSRGAFESDNFDNIKNKSKKRATRVCFNSKQNKDINHSLIDKGISFLGLILNDDNIFNSIINNIDEEENINKQYREKEKQNIRNIKESVKNYLKQRKYMLDSIIDEKEIQNKKNNIESLDYSQIDDSIKK